MPFIPPMNAEVPPIIATGETLGLALAATISTLSSAIRNVHRYEPKRILLQTGDIVRFATLAANSIPAALAQVGTAVSQAEYTSFVFFLYHNVSLGDAFRAKAESLFAGLVDMAEKYGDPRRGLVRQRAAITTRRNLKLQELSEATDPQEILDLTAEIARLTKELQNILEKLNEIDTQLADATTFDAKLMSAHSTLSLVANNLSTLYVKPLSTYHRARLLVAQMVALAP